MAEAEKGQRDRKEKSESDLQRERVRIEIGERRDDEEDRQARHRVIDDGSIREVTDLSLEVEAAVRAVRQHREAPEKSPLPTDRAAQPERPPHHCYPGCL